MIKIAIVHDYSLVQEPEDEVADILLSLESYGLDCELVVSGHAIQIIKDKDIDLLIIDYGGMSTMGAYDTAHFAVKEACKWAENHPGRLMVVWTYFTERLYEDELEEKFGYLDNIMVRYQGPDWKKGSDEFEDKLRLWFGLPPIDDSDRYGKLVTPEDL